MRMLKAIQKTTGSIGAAILILASLITTPHAEVVLDGTVGPKGSVSGPDYVITDAMGSQAGANLFHSFETFNKWGQSYSCLFLIIIV